MLYIHIHEYPIYSIGYRHIHISIYNIDIHVTSGHIFSGKYGHTCTLQYPSQQLKQLAQLTSLHG